MTVFVAERILTESPVTVLRECADRIEAELIRIRLSAAGIQTLITGTDAATALSMGGAGTDRLVRVEVDVDDYERAAALLEEDERRMLAAGPWICSGCSEQNEAAFEHCWSCDKPRTEQDERGRINEHWETEPTPGFASSMSVETPGQPIEDDANPYRPVLLGDSPHADVVAEKITATDAMTETARRAYLASIAGLIVFPPLVSLYSVYLLLTVDTVAYRAHRVRMIVAWLINSVTIPLWILYWVAHVAHLY